MFEPQVTDKLVNRIQMKQQHFPHDDFKNSKNSCFKYFIQIGSRRQNTSNDLCIQASVNKNVDLVTVLSYE